MSTTSTAAASKPRISSISQAREFLRSHPAFSVFLIALIVRIFISTILSRYFSGTLVLDDTTYHQMAADMAAGQRDHWDDFTNTLYWSTATFMVPVTFLYKIFGPNPIVAQLMIGVVGAGVAAFVTKLAAEVLETRWALLAGAIVALLPSQAFWSSMLMKDAFVWFVLSALGLTIAVAGRSTGRKLLLMGVIAAVLLVALSYLRLHTLVVASWAVMVAGFFGWKASRFKRRVGAVAVGTSIPLIFGGIGIAGLGLVTNAGSLEDRRFNNAVGANTAIVDTSQPPPGSGFIPEDVQAEVTILETKSAVAQSQVDELLAAAEELEEEDDGSTEQGNGSTEQRNGSTEQGNGSTEAHGNRAKEAARREGAERLRKRAAALAAKAESLRAAAAERLAEANTPVGVGDEPLDPDVAHLPRGLWVMLVEPFPVPFEGSLSLRLARLESIIWYPVLLAAIIGLWRARRNVRALAFPVLAGGGILVMYALAEGNVGTAHRHRGEFVWVVALLAALGLKHLIVGRRRSSSENA